MALLKFLKGNYADMAKASVVEGQVLICGDTGEMFVDVDGSSRVKIGDYVAVANLAALEAIDAATVPTSRLYYVEDSNILARSNGTIWVQINKDTGMTSIEVVGDGNAVTAASYDAVTRKLTLTKGETFATKAELDAVEDKVDDLDAYVGEIPEGYTETNVVDYINKKAAETLAAASGNSNETAASVKEQLDSYKAVVDPKLEALETKVGDKAVGEQIDEKIEALDLGNTYEAKGEASKVQQALNAYMGDNDEAVAAAKSAADEAKAAADAKVASVAPADDSVVIGGTATAPTVAVRISEDADNAITLEDDGLKVVIPAAAEYSIAKAENSGDYAAIYNLTKDGVPVGAAINIPKDMVVESGKVVENPEGQAEGTYIELKLQNVEDALYINVGSLIEYVTSGSQTGDMVVINISDDHKVTASITDGSITLAKLATDVQTAIGKAHSHENATVLDGINADKVAAWDAAEQNAKNHANSLNEAMDGRVQALEAIDHEHANMAELNKIADGDKAKWDEAAEKAHEHGNKAVIDGITAEKVSAWDNAQVNAEKTAAEALATVKSELEGKISAGDEATLNSAKALTNELANGAVAQNTEDISDILEQLTWGSF